MSAAARVGRRILLLLAFSAALFLFAGGGAPWLGTPARPAYADDAITDPFLGQPDAIAEGDDIYHSKCIVCHGLKGARAQHLRQHLDG
jgi:mono/diheme cytochrome c family protein